ncbi:serine/threonine-protein phosphatase [Candidatus Gracilibacteria bacterium]|nr:serine/threonine-protein phosphatase [Candidatus Gracilibacteria bacterium]
MFFKKDKKHTPELQNIKRYNEAIEVIRYYIAVEEWESAQKGITEIKNKEQKAYRELIEKLENEGNLNENEKNKTIKDYNTRAKNIAKLEQILNAKKEIFDAKQEKQRFKVRFKKIKQELDTLVGQGKNEDALKILQGFLEENKGNKYVIQYYNKEKRKIIKNIEISKKKEEKKYKDNAKLEALNLIGRTAKLETKKEEKEKKGIFNSIKKASNIYAAIQEKRRRKRIVDEINLLIEEDTKMNREIARKKLTSMHTGLIKEIRKTQMVGYDLYGKILGADKISGDTFGFHETKQKYHFFLGDATGHGIRAGFIVTLLTRVFEKFAPKSSLEKLTFEINNELKQNLQSRNFITGVFFEIDKSSKNTIDFVGMGHEPMYIYRDKTGEVEKLIPGGLAAGIRIIKDVAQIRKKQIILGDKDIVITYSDGVVEAKNDAGEYYGQERFAEAFERICKKENSIEKIYDKIIEELKVFKGGSTSFLDDTTVLMFQRNTHKDIIHNEDDAYLKQVQKNSHLKPKEVKKLKGKSKSEIEKELENIKKLKETKNIIRNLETLYYTGEILKLKQEAIRYIKLGYVDKKINLYLKKAIANESKYKIEQKEIKMRNKYNVLKELEKKGDYDTVIHELEDIIAKDGNI